MKELSKYTDQELKDELYRRGNVNQIAQWNKPPENVREYEIVDSKFKDDDSIIYIGQVFDGSEGFQLIIQAHQDTPEEEVLKMAKDYAIKFYGVEWNENMSIYDTYIDSIEIEEFGRYGFEWLKEKVKKDAQRG